MKDFDPVSFAETLYGLHQCQAWIQAIVDGSRQGSRKLRNGLDPWSRHLDYLEFVSRRCEELEQTLTDLIFFCEPEAEPLIREAYCWPMLLRWSFRLWHQEQFLERPRELIPENCIGFEPEDSIPDRLRDHEEAVLFEVLNMRQKARDLGFLTDYDRKKNSVQERKTV